MLAYDSLVDEQRQRLLVEIQDKWTGETATLAQVLIQLSGL